MPEMSAYPSKDHADSACEGTADDNPAALLAASEADRVRLIARLTELEVKACYADDLLDHLNRQVAEQQLTLDRLVAAVTQLRAQVDEASAAGGTGSADERPPHW